MIFNCSLLPLYQARYTFSYKCSQETFCDDSNNACAKMTAFACCAAPGISKETRDNSGLLLEELFWPWFWLSGGSKVFLWFRYFYRSHSCCGFESTPATRSKPFTIDTTIFTSRCLGQQNIVKISSMQNSCIQNPQCYFCGKKRDENKWLWRKYIVMWRK